MLHKTFFLLIATLLCMPTAYANRVLLGTVSLLDQKDRDVVTLAPCKTSNNKKISKIQLEIKRYNAEINKLKVVYHNGESQLLTVRQNFKAGTTSRWIDLNGAARCVNKIIVIGDTNTRRRTNRRQSKVTFWGFHPQKVSEKLIPNLNIKPQPIPVRPAPANIPNTMGVQLGKVRLTDRTDRDVVRLPACNTSANVGVNRVQLVVKEHPAEINRFKVVYYNGQMQVLDVRKNFAANSKSNWIDLKGEARCIKELIIIGDTQSLGRRPGKQALVLVNGLHFKDTAPAIPTSSKPQTPAVTTDEVVLGRVSLTDATDRDVVNLQRCSESNNRPVRALKLEAKRFSAQIDRFRVVFQNGQDQILSVRKTFEAGTSSRWIDLDGTARCIDKIIIIGYTNTLGRRPGRQATIVFKGK